MPRIFKSLKSAIEIWLHSKCLIAVWSPGLIQTPDRGPCDITNHPRRLPNHRHFTEVETKARRSIWVVLPLLKVILLLSQLGHACSRRGALVRTAFVPQWSRSKYISKMVL
jgi:hypothetical protein